MERIPPSERISRQIKEAIGSLNDKRSNQETLIELMRFGAQKIAQEILEPTVEEYLERGYYERKKNGKGYRNGYKQGKIKTENRIMEIEKPQVSDTKEKFHMNEIRNRRLSALV